MLHRTSLIESFIWSGHYDTKFTQTPTYDSLLIARLGGESQEDAWQMLSIDSSYDPHRSKATSLGCPALQYIHFLLSHILTGPYIIQVGVLFVGPYITRLVWGMGALEGTDRIRIMGNVISMTLETLRSMGMLESILKAHGVRVSCMKSISSHLYCHP